MQLARGVRSAGFVHASADVHARASIGRDTRIWHEAQIREDAHIGDQCIVGKGAYVDVGVVIGDSCKIQNYACIYREALLEDGVFVGPHAVLTNDRHPRAIESDGRPREWTPGKTVVGRGASIGARVVVLSGVTIGSWAVIGAGAIVTRDVPPHGLVVGCPGRLAGWACRCGRRVDPMQAGEPLCSKCADKP